MCFILIGVVLLQRGKGADLGASLGGGGANTLFGSRGAGNFLSKMTTGSAINEVGSTAVHGDVLLDTNDYIEVHIRNATGSNNVTVDFMYFYCMGMFM